jgi:hypothetical protein
MIIIEMVTVEEVIQEFRESEELPIVLARDFVDRLFKKLIEKMKYKKAEMEFIIADLLMNSETKGVL